MIDGQQALNTLIEPPSRFLAPADRTVPIAAGTVEHDLGEPVHERVDQLIRIVLTPGGQMQIAHGGLQVAVPEVALDDADVHPFLEQVCRIGVTEGMHGEFFQ